MSGHGKKRSSQHAPATIISLLAGKIKILLHNTIMLVNIVFVLLLLLSYLSARVSPQTLWVFSLAGLAYPFLLFVNLGFVIYWAIKRRILLVYSLIAILLGYNHLTDTFRIRFAQKLPDELHNTFTFLSYNVRLFNRYDWIEEPGLKNSIYEFLLSEDPDVLCIQEYFFNKDDQFNQSNNFRRLHERYKHIEYSSPNKGDFNFGIATFSKYPIINKGKISFVNSSNISIYTDIVINADTVRVFNCHLQSVQFTQDDISFLDNLGRSDNRRNIEGFKNIGSRLGQAFVRRSRQTDIITAHIRESPYPVIVTGDFNDTPVSYTYRQLRSQDLEDAFVISGSGIGRTYVSKLPLFRIDYILHGNELESFYFDIPKVVMSDHYPLKCEFSFKR
jgi:endonuclease/exonuclease/phosphatase family metal-dependent hydrolase